jgi:hypothetical protein
VGTATESKDEPWHDWVAKLCNSFPHIPDGAIQLAQLYLRFRRTSNDLTEAQKWLKEAYRRGIPFYSLGTRWLLEGLAKMGRFDPEIEGMCKAVQAVACDIHPQSVFTIVKLRRG